jgi:hypothetical protein
MGYTYLLRSARYLRASAICFTKLLLAPAKRFVANEGMIYLVNALKQ